MEGEYKGHVCPFTSEFCSNGECPNSSNFHGELELRFMDHDYDCECLCFTENCQSDCTGDI